MELNNSIVLLALALVVIYGALEWKVNDDAAKGVVSRDANNISKLLKPLHIVVTLGAAVGLVMLSYNTYKSGEWSGAYQGMF